VDMEGVADVAHEDQTSPIEPPHSTEHQRSRRLMTLEANAAIEGALATVESSALPTTRAHGGPGS
jgi:D-amino peptidase